VGVLLIAGLYGGVRSVGAEGLNRYFDWIIYYHGFKDLSFLENYHRIAGQLHQISESSAYRGIGQHVAETARIFLPFIYFLSMFQMLLATILVYNLVPLTWGFFRADYNVRQLLVLTLTAVLLALSYGFFIRMEIVLKRYMLMPSILLCPWVGFGIDKILTLVQRIPRSSLASACVVLVVFLYPVTEFDKFFKNRDDLASRAGSWIAKNQELNQLRLVYNDQIVKFHADLEGKIPGGATSLLHLDPSDKDFSKLFNFAKVSRAGGIIVQYRGDREELHNIFEGYKQIKELTNENKFVKIFVMESE
jgi:hypothetical protein